MSDTIEYPRHLSSRSAPARGDVAETGGALVLGRVLTTREHPTRDLYWRTRSDTVAGLADVSVRLDGGIAIGVGASLIFDTYFGAFFEMPWRLHTRLRTLALQLEVEGAPLLRIWRRVFNRLTLLHEATADEHGVIPLPTESLNFRQHGLVFFELSARDKPAVFRNAAWISTDTVVEPIGLAAVFCTFNRERDIAGVLGALTADPAALAHLSRIIVVNQGRPNLIAHPAIGPLAARLGPRLVVIEQGNFGGAGGFGRGLLAALDDPAIDHVVLLDDDIRMEPDSLARMAAFLSIAREDVPVGGHMLDSAQPTRLYEAGAVIAERHWTFCPQHAHLDLAIAHHLDRLGEPQPIHYNGWWCFGFPLRLIDKVGMPLPVFIRGDDTEFGVRLYEKGVRTVPLPGAAVWHEPFYLKLGSWQIYYETRNTLILMTVHRELDRRGNTRRMARQILIHLLTYRYYSTALIVRGIEDYLRGPVVLRERPAELHAGLTALRDIHPVGTVSRSSVLPHLNPPPLPRRRIGFLIALIRALGRNASAPTTNAPPQFLDVAHFSWLSVAKTDHVALETWWDRDMQSLRRSREQFRMLAPRAAKALWALYRRGPAVAAEWRAAHAEFVTPAFWRSYLAMSPAPTGTPAPATVSAEP